MEEVQLAGRRLGKGREGKGKEGKGSGESPGIMDSEKGWEGGCLRFLMPPIPMLVIGDPSKGSFDTAFPLC